MDVWNDLANMDASTPLLGLVKFVDTTRCDIVAAPKGQSTGYVLTNVYVTS